MHTLEFNFSIANEEMAGILVAELSAIGFIGFEQEENAVRAFIPEPELNETAFALVCKQYGWEPVRRQIAPANWNQVWESGFEPVVVDDFCRIRADFHAALHNTTYELEITPKMSFGTGHHATTYMMVQLMRDIGFGGKTVCDYGTGTGVLGILAEKMGAASVLAIDNDPQCMENAAENLAANGCSRTELLLATAVPENARFNIILANINLNVLCVEIPKLARNLLPQGVLLISGILESDREQITRVLADSGLQTGSSETRNGWLAMAAYQPQTIDK